MCGIAGIFAYGAKAPGIYESELLRTREAMAARGPDGCGLWISPDGRVGLAHRRLSIIDLSAAGAQPMSTADGKLKIVFNGEIYNYRELRAGLEAQGCRFASSSDTEVLLHLYRRKGCGLVHDLRGMYAFALWDDEQRGVFLARDPFGIKPLYYADDGQSLRFASQVRALLAGGAVNTAPWSAGHVGFFLWGVVPEPFTLYRGVRLLPSGTSLWLQQGGAGPETSCFCDVSDELRRAAAAPVAADSPEGRELLREALIDSVKHHFTADVPVGLFLSAGKDSTTLAALSTETQGRDIRTITLAFREYRGSKLDEAVLAERVAAQYGTRHTTITLSEEEFQGDLEHLLRSMDQPTIDGVNAYFVSKIAAQTGLKVAISGTGGDELFGGYDTFRQIPRMVRLLRPMESVKWLGRTCRRVCAPTVGRLANPRYAGLLEYGGSHGGAYLLLRSLFLPWELPEVLPPKMVREGLEELAAMESLKQTARDLPSDASRVSALEIGCYLRSQLLRDSDWAGMAHSIEIRVPLVDIEFLRRIAPLMVGAAPLVKRHLTSTPASPLLPEILNRPKSGFAVPIGRWLRRILPPTKREWWSRTWARYVYTRFTGLQS